MTGILILVRQTISKNFVHIFPIHSPKSNDLDFNGGRRYRIKFREEESIPLPISARIGEGVACTLDFPKYFDKKFNIGVAEKTRD